jgi:signal transduction histidine kinase
MKRYTIFLLMSLLVWTMVWAGNDDPRYAAWPLYMRELQKVVLNNNPHNTLKDVEHFMARARQSRVKDCVSYAYYFRVFYFTVIAPDIVQAEAALRTMERERMNETDINLSKFDVIYYYQVRGMSVKAVALCRSILNTTRDKRSIAEANYNIMLLYQNLGMNDQALRKALEMCRFTAGINGKKDFHYSLANFYSCVADLYLEMGRYREALPYLQKTDSTVSHDGWNAPSAGNNDMRFVTVMWGKYYLGMNDYRKVWGQIDKLRDYHDVPLLAYSYSLEAKYHLKLHEYERAKVAVDSMVVIAKRCGVKYGDPKRLMMSAQIALGMGDFKSAASFYAQYIAQNDSLKKQADELNTSEYSVLLNVEKSNLEKSEYKARAEHYHLQLTRVIGGVVLLVCLAAVVMLFSMRRMNRKLNLKNRELQEAYERVDRLNKMKDSFIQNVSHEIRTPLNSIVGFSQILGAQNEEDRQYADIINKSSFQLLEVVDHVLEISDLESGDIAMSPMSVDENCVEVMNGMKEQLGGGLKLVYEPQDKALVIDCNAYRFKQVVRSLLDNAFKFAEAGTVTLRYEVEDEELHLFVKDTGPGIPADKAEWVFERFAKLSEFSLGSGLGLSVCRLIVEKLGGRVRIDTTYREGCKVDVWIPTSKGNATAD